MKDLDEKRINFNLDENSVVLNLGGYTGEWALRLFNKYRCNIYIYEPVKEFFDKLVDKFNKDPKVKLFNFGVFDKNVELPIVVSGDGTSIFKKGGEILLPFKDISEVFSDFDRIDLLEINVEGSEYAIIDRLYQVKKIDKATNYLIQFHTVEEDTAKKVDRCRTLLGETHKCLWNYDMIFECWTIK